jgi:hypothetical protein
MYDQASVSLRGAPWGIHALCSWVSSAAACMNSPRRATDRHGVGTPVTAERSVYINRRLHVSALGRGAVSMFQRITRLRVTPQWQDMMGPQGLRAVAGGSQGHGTAPQTVGPQPPDDSGDTGGSADGPNSERPHHSAGRTSVPHTHGVSKVCSVDFGGMIDSWRSSGRTGWHPGVFAYVIGHQGGGLNPWAAHVSRL